MKIPQEMLVKGETYEIEQKWAPKDSDGRRVYGLCFRDRRLIHIDRSLPHDERELVFVHELFHAVVTELRNKKKLNWKKLSEETEELLVEELSLFVMEAFKLRLK